VVDGAFFTGVCHLWVSRGARLDAETVTRWTREHGEWLHGGCTDVGLLSYFRATVRGLPPGAYHVRVEYGAGARAPHVRVLLTTAG
jgi:hypothetical protein